MKLRVLSPSEQNRPIDLCNDYFVNFTRGAKKWKHGVILSWDETFRIYTRKKYQRSCRVWIGPCCSRSSLFSEWGANLQKYKEDTVNRCQSLKQWGKGTNIFAIVTRNKSRNIIPKCWQLTWIANPRLISRHLHVWTVIARETKG